MIGSPQHYFAYMLRLWQAGGDEEPVWCASLESAHTGERQMFADLEALFAFLTEKTEVAEGDQPRRHAAEPGGLYCPDHSPGGEKR